MADSQKLDLCTAVVVRIEFHQPQSNKDLEKLLKEIYPIVERTAEQIEMYYEMKGIVVDR